MIFLEVEKSPSEATGAWSTTPRTHTFWGGHSDKGMQGAGAAVDARLLHTLCMLGLTSPVLLWSCMMQVHTAFWHEPGQEG